MQKKELKILAIHNNSGSRFYRIIPQLKAMQEAGHKVIMEPHDTEHLDQKIQWADIVLFEMVFTSEWIKYAKKLGKKVIFECDDLIHTVPKTHYSYKETKGWKKVKWLWDIYRLFRLCDALIVSNRELKGVYGWMAKRCLIFPNYLDLNHWLKEFQPNTTDKIRLLWAGSTSHTGDLKMIQPVLKRILDKFPQVQFIYIGMGGIKSSDPQARFIYGEDFFEGLPENRESMLPVPSNVWPYIFSTLMADIAIAPLEKNYFNKFKTQCKFLEYSINRIPGVYSRWFYKDVKDGVTGFLAETEDEWVEALTKLINSVQLRKEVGNNAYENALQNYNVDNYTEKWRGFLENL